MFEKITNLIDKTNFEKIKNANILVVGIGGVGGTALECLVRSGFENITIIDFDVFEITNLNRQIIAEVNSINQLKTSIAKEKYQKINPKLNLTTKNIFLDETNIKKLDKYDYILDACDSVKTKIELIKYAKNNNIIIISAMGMGNRIDPTKIYLTKLNKTENDPLAKKIRGLLKKENIDLNIDVVASKEIPIKNKNIISSMMMCPSTAGLYMAYFIIRDIIKE